MDYEVFYIIFNYLTFGDSAESCLHLVSILLDLLENNGLFLLE